MKFIEMVSFQRPLFLLLSLMSGFAWAVGGDKIPVGGLRPVKPTGIVDHPSDPDDALLEKVAPREKPLQLLLPTDQASGVPSFGSYIHSTLLTDELVNQLDASYGGRLRQYSLDHGLYTQNDRYRPHGSLTPEQELALRNEMAISVRNYLLTRGLPKFLEANPYTSYLGRKYGHIQQRLRNLTRFDTQLGSAEGEEKTQQAEATEASAQPLPVTGPRPAAAEAVAPQTETVADEEPVVPLPPRLDPWRFSAGLDPLKLSLWSRLGNSRWDFFVAGDTRWDSYYFSFSFRPNRFSLNSTYHLGERYLRPSASYQIADSMVTSLSAQLPASWLNETQYSAVIVSFGYGF